MSIQIGTWVEKETRKIERCPSYYAADHETLETIPGEYPLYVTFKGGYLVPMPDGVTCGIETVRVDGALYSGFGGVNFASTPLEKGVKVTYCVRLCPYTAKNMVKKGVITIDEGFEWLLTDKPWEHPSAPKNWEEVNALKAERIACGTRN